ncbi:MAG: hypothetical protein ACFFE2_11955 [Candidatus Thorarchaeota archaeon]
MKYHPERIGIGLVILLPLIYMLWLSDPAWDTASSAIAYYSVLAFLCVTMTVSVANKTRLDPSPSNNMLFTVTTYASIVFSGAAIFYIVSADTPIHVQTSGAFLNLVALATAGIMMLLYSTLDGYVKKEESLWYRRFTPYFLVTISIIIFIVSMIVARLPFATEAFLVAGYIFGGIAVVTFVLAAIFTLRQRESLYSNDPIRLSFAFLLLAAASVNHIIILPNPSALWIVSIGLMGLALLLANVAISYTFLREMGISDTIAYLMTITTSVLALVPFAIAHLVNSVLTAAPMVDIGATLIIHFGGATLAGVSAVALFIKARERSAPDQLAIVFMLIFWMICEIALIASHFSPVYGFESESMVPYIAGGIVATITLFVAVRRILNPRKRMFHTIARIYAIGIILAPVFILAAEYVRREVYLMLSFPEDVIGPAMMLALSYLSLYALLMYITLKAGASGGEFSIDSIGAGLAAIWVIVVILKANFAYATPGWWVAEAIMLISTALFMVILLVLYQIESDKTENLVPRVAAYSQLLSETIVAHQKTAIDTLSRFTEDADEAKLDAIAVILTNISRANEHAKFLESVISGEKFDSDSLEPMDLRDAIDLALSRSNIPETVRWKENEGKDVQTCIVNANNLLVDLFYNIFQGITKRIGSLELAEVDFRDDADNSDRLCEVVLDMIVRVDDIDQVLGLLKRYMTHSPLDVIEFAYMKRLVELFEGSIEWKTEVASKESILITMIVGLPRGVR